MEAGSDDELAHLQLTHDVIDEIWAFNGIEITRNRFPGFSIRKKKAILIYKRK